jgi:signal transduction histidine kinase
LRRRLATLSLATTTLVVISLVVPLALLVRQQAADNARAIAEREARSTAALVALALSLGTDPANVEAAVGTLTTGTIVVTSTGVTVGEALAGQGGLVEPAMSLQATITGEVAGGGWEIALPVIGRDQSAVVDVFVTEDRLREGVGEAWVMLGLLGLMLVGVAVLVADRLGKRLVGPIRDLSAAAERMSDGDLSVRVTPGEPDEVRHLGQAFNTLALRLDGLLTAEREAVADLSHRLRTPLTSLRLQAEGIADPEERALMVAQVDRLEDSVDDLIVSARGRGAEVGRCDLDRVVAERASFWGALADEQERPIRIDVGGVANEVGLTEAQVMDLVDVLVGNVFAHTPSGVGFEISTGRAAGRPWLRVADEGPGFAGPEVRDRGVSGAGSTGLGLDIARRIAELAGGALEMSDRPGGGAVVTVWLGA